MNNFEAINKRKSTRKFIDKKIDNEALDKIKKIIEDINQESGLTIQLIENGEDAFASIKKSYGMFNNVKSVVLLKGANEEVNLEEKIGFFGEKLCIELVKMQIDNCWVAGTYDKDAFKNYVKDDEKLVCVMPIGIGVDSISTTEKIVGKLMKKNARKLEMFYKSDRDIPKWLEEGIIAVQKAPSAINKQPVRIKYTNDEVTIYLENSNKYMLIDLGIAKSNFVMCSGGVFNYGDNAKYTRKI